MIEIPEPSADDLARNADYDHNERPLSAAQQAWIRRAVAAEKRATIADNSVRTMLAKLGEFEAEAIRQRQRAEEAEQEIESALADAQKIAGHEYGLWPFGASMAIQHLRKRAEAAEALLASTLAVLKNYDRPYGVTDRLIDQIEQALEKGGRT